MINNIKSSIPDAVFDALKDIYQELCKSVKIMTASSNMLLMHVEDILGYAQLKAGKFTKDIHNFNIRQAVAEIVSIQQYKAEAKNINIDQKFLGFPTKD